MGGDVLGRAAHRIIDAVIIEPARRQLLEVGAQQGIAAGLLQSRQAQLDIARLEPGRELAQALERRAVEIRRFLEAEDHHPRVRVLQYAVPYQRQQRLGVGEEQRLFGPHDQNARRARRLRKALHTDEIVCAHAAEHGQARARQ